MFRHISQFLSLLGRSDCCLLLAFWRQRVFESMLRLRESLRQCIQMLNLILWAGLMKIRTPLSRANWTGGSRIRLLTIWAGSMMSGLQLPDAVYLYCQVIIGKVPRARCLRPCLWGGQLLLLMHLAVVKRLCMVRAVFWCPLGTFKNW